MRNRLNPNILPGQIEYRVGGSRFMLERQEDGSYAAFFLGGHLVKDGFTSLTNCKGYLDDRFKPVPPTRRAA